MLQKIDSTTDKSHRDPAVYAESYCDRLITAFDRKASHNKAEALYWFVTIVVCTTSTPMFITLGENWIFAKLIPSLASAIAAGGTAWLQLRKPQQLWALYRTAHRELEDHRVRYDNFIGPYADESERHKILAENAADIAIGAHYDWLPVVPSVRQLDQTSANSRAAHSRKKNR